MSDVRPIRVLIVDDSALMRELIADCLSTEPGIEVVGKATDGHRALNIIESAKPDVVTLDVQMPKMNGLEALDEILASQPVPVIMVSALTQLGAETTFEALERGAVDYVAKPENAKTVADVFGRELVRKVRMAAGADVRRLMEIRRERKQRAAARRPLRGETPAPSEPGLLPTELADKCIALGISTGGPPALTTLFESLAPPMPPILVVQHMPRHFTGPLAWRLDSVSKLTVREAAAGDTLRPNHVYIAPGGIHLGLRRVGKHVRITLDDSDPVSGHKPSVDVMMTAAARCFGQNCLGIIMTGMGRDGSDGCGAIRAAGGYVLGQDQESSDVYGMNKVALVEGNVDRQFSLDEAAAMVSRQVRSLWQSRAAELAR